MKQTSDVPATRVNGFQMLLVEVALLSISGFLFYTGVDQGGGLIPTIAVACFMLTMVCTFGFFTVAPNQARVLTFFGKYVGTVREAGFHWTNPLAKRGSKSLRIRNFNSEKLKINDAQGNPIIIGAVVVWRIVDAARATFDVQDVDAFVARQSETALRAMASRHPYDAYTEDGSQDLDRLSLRAHPDEVAQELQKDIQARLESAGVEVMEARIQHLAYAQEIAQAMLRRQQADAIISARRRIVDGAVGMVEMALQRLEREKVVDLDEERKAAMINNLLVAVVSEREAQPIVNTGSLYS